MHLTPVLTTFEAAISTQLAVAGADVTCVAEAEDGALDCFGPDRYQFGDVGTLRNIAFSDRAACGIDWPDSPSGWFVGVRSRAAIWYLPFCFCRVENFRGKLYAGCCMAR